MFRKKQKPQSRRTRQPLRPEAKSAQPVFSYHASRSTTPSPNTNSRSVTWLWSNAPASPRPTFRRWPKRLPKTVIVVLAAAFSLYNLFLSNNSQIVMQSQAPNAQVLLRDQLAYETAVKTALASSPLHTNKVTINTAKIEAKLQQQFPEINAVTVDLPFIGRQPTVYFEPARPALLLKTIDGGLFLVNTSGRALLPASEAKQVEKMGLVVVEDQSGLPVQPGRNVLPSTNVAFITEVAGQLKAKQVPITGMILAKGAGELDVRINGVPYIVKCNLHGDARAEVGAYLATKKYLEREGKIPSSYIDVRVDNRVYYK